MVNSGHSHGSKLRRTVRPAPGPAGRGALLAFTNRHTRRPSSCLENIFVMYLSPGQAQKGFPVIHTLKLNENCG